MNGSQDTNLRKQARRPEQSIKQARRPEFYKHTRLPVTRWVANTITDQFDRNAILTVYIYVAIPYQGFVRRQKIFNLPFVADNLLKKRPV